jgi:hypothetical protein
VSAQVADGGQDVERGAAAGIQRGRPLVRLAEAAQVEGEDAKAGINENPHLRRPALIGEPAAMHQDDSAPAGAIESRVDLPAAPRRKDDGGGGWRSL